MPLVPAGGEMPSPPTRYGTGCWGTVGCNPNRKAVRDPALSSWDRKETLWVPLRAQAGCAGSHSGDIQTSNRAHAGVSIPPGSSQGQPTQDQIIPRSPEPKDKGLFPLGSCSGSRPGWGSWGDSEAGAAGTLWLLSREESGPTAQEQLDAPGTASPRAEGQGVEFSNGKAGKGRDRRSIPTD